MSYTTWENLNARIDEKRAEVTALECRAATARGELSDLRAELGCNHPKGAFYDETFGDGRKIRGCVFCDQEEIRRLKQMVTA